MRFSVPFEASEHWLEMLELNLDRLHSVYFSLHDSHVPDARTRLRNLPAQRLSRLLGRLPGPRKYALVNSRFHSNEHYLETEPLAAVARLLGQLLDQGQLTGIVFSDFYLLTALSRAEPGLCARIEAVPSVNLMPDSPDRLAAILDMLDTLGFKPPGKLCLDRSLNKRLGRLERTVDAARRLLPNAAIELLANEGCLDVCPFKPAHDAINAAACLPGGREQSFEVNRRLGCLPVWAAEPWRALASPLIRPEDAHRYQGLADALKLCGRNKSPGFLPRVLAAYLHGRYAGNLLDLADVLEESSDRVHIDNSALPEEYWETTANCARVCRECGWCAALFRRVGEVRDTEPFSSLSRM